jgi:hypothetical protein
MLRVGSVGRSAGRRGLLAGAAALLAALVRPSARTAEAGVDGDVVLGATSPAIGTIGTTTTINAGANEPGFSVINVNAGANSGAIEGISSAGAYGVRGGSGVLLNVRNVGVVGTALSAHFPDDASARGVYGSAANYGVHGRSVAGVGVYGQTTSIYGVLGIANGIGYGVFGSSPSSIGVLATSTSSAGLWAQSGSGHAGVFIGPVVVQGSFTVTGGAKSAAVPHPDGSLRRLYCLESPESYFEDFGDFGEGRLANGQARVGLDHDFAALVHGEGYRVFLTPEGDCNGLYVASKRPEGFEVRELKGGQSGIAFGYRVVAKRKDIAGPRLERVAAPGKRPEVPSAPKDLPIAQ